MLASAPALVLALESVPGLAQALASALAVVQVLGSASVTVLAENGKSISAGSPVEIGWPGNKYIPMLRRPGR